MISPIVGVPVSVISSICLTLNKPPLMRFSNAGRVASGIIIDPSFPPKQVTLVTSFAIIYASSITGVGITPIDPE